MWTRTYINIAYRQRVKHWKSAQFICIISLQQKLCLQLDCKLITVRLEKIVSPFFSPSRYNIFVYDVYYGVPISTAGHFSQLNESREEKINFIFYWCHSFQWFINTHQANERKNCEKIVHIYYRFILPSNSAFNNFETSGERYWMRDKNITAKKLWILIGFWLIDVYGFCIRRI